MINQLNNSSVNKNIFAPFQTNGTPYAITKPFTEQQKIEREQEKDKKNNRIGLKITTAVGIAALIVASVAMAFSKKSRGKLHGFAKKISGKIDELSNNKNQSRFADFRLKALKITNKILVNSKSIFNLGNLKDILFKVGFKKFKPLREFSDAATKVFIKISNNTAKGAYNGTRYSFENMYEQFAKYNKKFKIPEEKVKEIERKIADIKLKYDKSFGIEERNSRLDNTVKELGKIDDIFLDRTWRHPIKFAKKDAYTTFLAEDIAYPAKSEQSRKVIGLKAEISFSEKDSYNDIKKHISKADLLIDPTLKEPAEIINKLNAHLNSFKVKQDAESKNLIIQELQNLQKYCSKVPEYEKISTDLADMIKHLKTDKPGKIQEIMELYRSEINKGITEKDYAKLERTVNRATSSLNRSVDIETDKLFDKIRDIQLGGAPHDILAILASVGYVGYELAKVDNKDERISVTLKYGIPVIGAVVTSLYCALGLVSGGKSLIIGTLSGLAINKLGEFIDKLRKKHNKTEAVINGSTKLIGDMKDSLTAK